MNKPIVKGSSTGWAKLALSMARINMVFWEDLKCNIEILTGENNRPKYEGVSLIMPSIGARHFLGGIPEIGDICVVAWFASNTNSKADQKSPAIVGWMPRSTFLGHEWLPTQDFSPQENLLNNPKERKENKAVVNRVRHKLRHFSSGNIGASSAQGSDLVLDESVLLSNRRSNEIRLRDQDQAIVMRSLQQFHSTAGSRIYSGMVQRDSRSLPKEMFSTSIEWNQDFLTDQDREIQYEDSTKQNGLFNPHPLFLRENGSNIFDSQGGVVDLNINPYKFLYDAKLINSDGLNNTKDSDVYGGKTILRVNTKGEQLDSSNTEALCEYRIEVSHTSDGTLPVNEQTDGFDADRLLNIKNLPIVEFVLGTPVGNDPITDKGILNYGKPLYISFDGDDVSLDAINDNVALDEQLVTLTSINPLVDGIEDTILGFTKGGAFRSFIGSTLEDAFKTRIEGGVSASIGNALNVKASQVQIESEGSAFNDASLVLSSKNGAINIKSSGTYVPNQSQEDADSFDAELSRIGIRIQSNSGISLESENSVSIKAPVFDLSNASEISINSQTGLSLTSGDKIEVSTKHKTESVTGKYELVISGPSDFNPLNIPPKSEIIGANPATGFPGGIVDAYTCAYGDKVNVFLTTSNVTTTITSGSYNVLVGAGIINHVAGGTAIAQNPSGVSISSAVGAVSLNCGGGVVSINSGVSTGIRSVGVSSLSGASVVLGSVGAGVGFIMCMMDRDPLTGRTFLESGMLLPRGQILSPTIV